MQSAVDYVCEPQGSVVGVLNDHPAGSAPGTVLLPNREVSNLHQIRATGPGIIDQEWKVTFSDADAPANFDGLVAYERTWIAPEDPDSCDMVTGFDSDWVLVGNSLIDQNTKGVESDATCRSVVSQVFDIGSCTIPPVNTPIKLAFDFVGGEPTFTRSDEEQ